jgi:hypothetical protein
MCGTPGFRCTSEPVGDLSGVSPRRSVGSFRGSETATVANVDPQQIAVASVAVNAVLVVVTAVYVVLTWRLARSSSAAAESAAEAARAAADSARSQRAALDVETNRSQASFKMGGGGASYEKWEFAIIPLDGAYVLRKVVLQDIHFMPKTPNAEGVQMGVQVRPDRAMEPKGRPFPRLVDEFQGAMFELDVAALAREVIPHDDWEVLYWSCEVTYSLSASADGERRVIVYSNSQMDPRLHRLRAASALELA